MFKQFFKIDLRSRYHALRGNVFFDALRHGGTTGYIAAKKFFWSMAFPGRGRKASEETCPRKAWAREYPIK